jgi:hypothetical protein
MNMKPVVEKRQELAAVTAWLNCDSWYGRMFELPDGWVFPQQETEEFIEPVRVLVSELIALGWDLFQWRERHPKDWDVFERGLRQYRPLPILDSKRRLMLHYEPVGALVLPSLWWVLVFLLMNPEHGRLGRCPRCQRFYVSKRRYVRRRRLYCSRHCAHNAAASQYVGRQHAAYRKKRLALARRLLRRWRPRFGDWKPWLVSKTRGGPVMLTKNFLTRCELRRELFPPKKGERNADRDRSGSNCEG